MDLFRNRFMQKRALYIFAAYVLIALLYFSRAFIHGEIIAPGDGLSYFYPLKLFFANELTSGNFPLWNPYIFSGLPFYASHQSGVFYPFNFLFIIPSEAFVFNILLLFHYALAAFFTYCLIRSLDVDEFSAFIGGFVFTFSGFMQAHKGHTNMINAAVWLPLILFLFEKIRCEKKMIYSILSAAAIAMQILAGHFQMCINTYLVLILYLAYHITLIEKQYRARFIMQAIIALFAGFVFAAPQLYATYELSELSVRQKMSYASLTEYSFSLKMLPTLIFPYFFGTGYAKPYQYYWGDWSLGEIIGFVGIFPLLAAFIAGVTKRRNLHVRFFAGLLVISFLLSLGRNTPLYKLIHHIPLINQLRIPGRHWFQADLAISVLSAFTIQSIFCDNAKRRKIVIVMSCLITSIFAASIIWIKITQNILEQRLRASITDHTVYYIRKMQVSDVLHTITFTNPAIFIPIIFLSAYLIWSLSILFFHRNKFSQALLLIIIFAECFLFGIFQDPIYPKRNYVERFGNDLSKLKYKRSDDYRMLFIPNEIYKNTLTSVPLHISKINGYDPLIISDFHKLTGIFPGGYNDDWYGLLQNNLTLSMLAVRDIIIEKDVGFIAEHIENIGLLHNESQEQDSSTTSSILRGIWRGANSNYEKGEYVLQAKGGIKSVIYQNAALKSNTGYSLSFRLLPRAFQTGALIVGFYEGENFKKCGDEIRIIDEWLDGDYIRMERKLTTSKITKTPINLLFYTTSHDPYCLSEISLFQKDNFIPKMNPIKTNDAKDNYFNAYKKVSETDKWIYAQNQNSLKRAYFISEIKEAADINDLAEKLRTLKINPARECIVSHEDLRQIGRTSFSGGEVNIKEAGCDKITLSLKLDAGDGFLVLSDQYYPGWHAYIDGKETQIYKVNGIMRGALILKGSKEIVFKYEPCVFIITVFISIAAIMLAGLFFIDQLKRKIR